MHRAEGQFATCGSAASCYNDWQACADEDTRSQEACEKCKGNCNFNGLTAGLDMVPTLLVGSVTYRYSTVCAPLTGLAAFVGTANAACVTSISFSFCCHQIEKDL